MLQRLCVIGATAVTVLLPLPGVRAEEKVMTGQTQAAAEKAVKEYADKGWYPSTVKGYAKGKESRFNVTWRSEKKGPWYLYVGMSADGFAKRKQEAAKEGYKLAEVSSWTVNGEKQFAAIWYKKK